MKPLKNIYKGGYFKRRDSLAWRSDPICDSIVEILGPKSVIDVGCAVGDLIKGFDKRGITCYGIEGSENAFPFLMVDKDRVFLEDLRLPLRLPMHFDLAMCLEVAEHIEPEHSDQFVANLIGLSHRILLSAAPPGQGGHYHVNCQPKEYWVNKFIQYGYFRISDVETRLTEKWEPWKHKPGIKAYYNNLLFFQRRTKGGKRVPRIRPNYYGRSETGTTI